MTNKPKIKEGGVYRMRNGQTVGPMEYIDDLSEYVSGEGSRFIYSTRHPNGCWVFPNSGSMSGYDIVEEVSYV